MFNKHLLLLASLVLVVASSSASAQFILHLSASPQRSNCTGADRYACEALDSVEASGYQMARAGRITWLMMVDRFYQERSRIFPQMRDDYTTAEIRSYQRVLAERKDAGKITEAEWVFLLNRQRSALAARDARVDRSIEANNAMQHQMEMQRQQMQMQQQQEQQRQWQQQQQQQMRHGVGGCTPNFSTGGCL